VVKGSDAGAPTEKKGKKLGERFLTERELNQSTIRNAGAMGKETGQTKYRKSHKRGMKRSLCATAKRCGIRHSSGKNVKTQSPKSSKGKKKEQCFGG